MGSAQSTSFFFLPLISTSMKVKQCCLLAVVYTRSKASLREGYGNPLQYSCLENPMDRGAWQATVHGDAKSQTRLRWLSMHALPHTALVYSSGPERLPALELTQFQFLLVSDCTSPATSTALSFILNTQPGFYHMTLPPFPITDHEVLL